MTPRTWLFIAAIFAGLSVALGAFGAHGLPGFLAGRGVSEEELVKRLANWETAARYQMYHALAMLAVASATSQISSLANYACWSWLAGTIIFSGCLFLLVISGVKILGAVVPLGGLLLILGWALFAVAALRT